MIAIQAQLTSYDAVTHVHEHDSTTVNKVRDDSWYNCTCLKCGKNFHAAPRVIKCGWGKYCSRKCADKAKIKRIIFTCPQCKKRHRRASGKLHNSIRKFCNKDCQHKYSVGENSPRWSGGVSFGKYCYKFNATLKEEIRAQFGFKCFFCGTYEGNTKHHVHHVDYNKVQGCKGQKWALIPLDNRCHNRTNSNRWYWFCLLRDYWVYGQYEGFELWVPDKSYFRKGGKR